MLPKERRDSGQNDLFKSHLDQIVDMNHALAKLARQIDWGFLEGKFGAVYADVICCLGSIGVTPKKPIGRRGSDSRFYGLNLLLDLIQWLHDIEAGRSSIGPCECPGGACGRA